MAILQIGAGGVGWVIAHKCAQHNDVFGDIVIASRGQERLLRLADSIARKRSMKDPFRKLDTRLIDVHDVDALVGLINEVRPELVINAGPPWTNVDVMEACVRTGSHYLDTSVATDLCSPGQQVPQAYDPQWAFHQRFLDAGITGILSVGFDPGVVSIFAAHAARKLFDRIDAIDVLDVNAGSHGRKFATNFDPETNLLEIQGNSFYWEEGRWHEVGCHQRMIEFDFPELGRMKLYSMAHDEVRSLVEYLPARRIEFWMGFSDLYLRYFNVLRDVGMLSPKPVRVSDAVTVAPLKVLKALLPDPTSLAAHYSGKTCIGTLVSGVRHGRARRVFLYNLCDHQHAYRDVEAQAISYTTGVPAVTAALLFFEGAWRRPGVWNPEQLDPAPFLAKMPELGLNWAELEVPEAAMTKPLMLGDSDDGR